MELGYVFTSESVMSGHPDKVADLIADSLLDELIRRDPEARLGCEVQVSPNQVALAGEMRLDGEITDEEIAQLVRNVIRDIGYDREDLGFSADEVFIINNMHKQSPDIAMGVDEDDKGKEIGAGDNGMMFGYATDESKEMLPMPLLLSHKLVRELDYVRKNCEFGRGLRPDGKVQVSVYYDSDNKPTQVTTVVVCISHDENMTRKQLEEIVKYEIVGKVFGDMGIPYGRLLVNPTGRFVECGPFADSGVVGRKIVVDQYGGMAPVGGGSLIGKDPTKVDRSGAYIARNAAVSLVAGKLCERCLVQVSYAIGMSEPISMMVDSYGTVKGDLTDRDLEGILLKNFDFSPGGIIRDLKLRRPIYADFVNYGQFGRTEETAEWEKPRKLEI